MSFDIHCVESALSAPEAAAEWWRFALLYGEDSADGRLLQFEDLLFNYVVHFDDDRADLSEGGGLILEVGAFTPVGELADLADQAGLLNAEITWPLYTRMWVSSGKVLLQRGPHAQEWITLWERVA